MNSIFKERIKPHDKLNVMGIDEYLKQVGLEEGRKKGIRQGRRQGRQEGREEERQAFAQTLLTNTEFDDDKIASLAKVPVENVKKLRAGLQAK